MDPSAIAAMAVGMKAGAMRSSVATEMVKSSLAQDRAAADMVAQAAENAKRATALASGVGQVLDISV